MTQSSFNTDATIFEWPTYANQTISKKIGYLYEAILDLTDACHQVGYWELKPFFLWWSAEVWSLTAWWHELFCDQVARQRNNRFRNVMMYVGLTSELHLAGGELLLGQYQRNVDDFIFST